jgi:hypothetical protein
MSLDVSDCLDEFTVSERFLDEYSCQWNYLPDVLFHLKLTQTNRTFLQLVIVPILLYLQGHSQGHYHRIYKCNEQGNSQGHYHRIYKCNEQGHSHMT